MKYTTHRPLWQINRDLAQAELDRSLAFKTCKACGIRLRDDEFFIEASQRWSDLYLEKTIALQADEALLSR